LTISVSMVMSSYTSSHKIKFYSNYNMHHLFDIQHAILANSVTMETENMIVHIEQIYENQSI